MIDYGLGVSLRRITEEDLPKLFEWRNNPLVWKWCRQNSPLHWAGHLSWFKKQAIDPKISMFAISDGSYVVGVCGLTDIDLTNRRAEFSLYINPNLHRGGYGTKALKTLFMHGFNDLGLYTIFGETFDGNPAYKMFIEKLGMIHEGTRRNFYWRGGSFTNCYLISTTADDFAARFAKAPDPDPAQKGTNPEGQGAP